MKIILLAITFYYFCITQTYYVIKDYNKNNKFEKCLAENQTNYENNWKFQCYNTNEPEDCKLLPMALAIKLEADKNLERTICATLYK